MHDQESCDKRYVSWFWLVGILVTVLVGGIAMAWTGGGDSVRLKNTLNVHEARLIKLEMVSTKLDTVIAIVKELQKR
jgi:hypothetical protein